MNKPLTVVSLLLILLTGVCAVLVAVGNSLQAIDAILSWLWFVTWPVALITSGLVLVAELIFIEYSLRIKCQPVNIFGIRIKTLKPKYYAALLGMIAVSWVPVIGGYLRPQPSEPPEYASIHYAFVVDATARMNASFQGTNSKWMVAKGATLQYLDRLPPGANYTLVVMGGNQTGSSATCVGPDKPLIPLHLGNRSSVSDQVEQMEPEASGSLTEALKRARDALLDKPKGDEKTVYVIVGGPDECAQGDKWDALPDDIQTIFNQGIAIHTEMIVLVNETVRQEVIERIGARLRTLGQNIDVALVDNEKDLQVKIDTDIDHAYDRIARIAPEEFATERPTLVAGAATAAVRRTGIAVATAASTLVSIIPSSGSGQGPVNPLSTPLTSLPTPILAITSNPTATPIPVVTVSPTLLPPSQTIIPLSPTQLPTETHSPSPPPSATYTAIPPTPVPSSTALPPTQIPTSTATSLPSPNPCVSTRIPLTGPSYPGEAIINSPATCSTNHPPETEIPTSGTYSGVPTGLFIWILAYSPEGLYYPQSPDACAARIADQGNGIWSVPVYLGNRDGGPPEWFDIVVVVTDQSTSDYLAAWVQSGCLNNNNFVGIPPSDLVGRNVTEKNFIRVETQE
jgi:hypothetical protein